MIDTTRFDQDRLLGRWRWLVPEGHSVLAASALGDLFLANSEGHVLWLDVGRGSVEKIARSVKALYSLLDNGDAVDYYLGRRLVEDLHTRYNISEGECYSYVMLPMLGGTFEVVNFKIRSIYNHLNGWGPICEEIAGMPDGTAFQLRVID